MNIHKHAASPWLLLRALVFSGLVFAASAYAADAPITLDYRLRPDRDLTIETVTNAITTFRVVEDRGLIARSNGQMSGRPNTMHFVSRQTIRQVSSSSRADGSYLAELRFLSNSTALRAPNGQEMVLPDKHPIQGLRVSAVLEASGKLRDGSVQVTGAEPSVLNLMRNTLTSLVVQSSSIEPIELHFDRGTQQQLAMKIPLPGIAELDLKLNISNQLLAVENGVARIQQIFSMDFTTPVGVLKMTADGRGAGSMLYEVATQTLLSNESGTLTKLLLELPDGTLEIQMNSKQQMTTRPTEARAR